MVQILGGCGASSKLECRRRVLMIGAFVLVAGFIVVQMDLHSGHLPSRAKPAAFEGKPAAGRADPGPDHDDKEEEEDDAFAAMEGKRVLQVGSYFLFDFASGLKLHHQAVDSQFCEYAASRGVKVDLLMSGYDKESIMAQKNPFGVMRPCLDQIVVCTEQPIECYEKYLSKKKYAGVWTRDDDVNYAVHEIAKRQGLPTMFDRKLGPLSLAQLTSKGQNDLLLGKKASRFLPDCENIPDDLVYPGFIRYAKGVHATGGWGAQCLRHMSSVRNKAELARKMPFFCGAGMRSYSVLHEAAAKVMYYTPLNFGVELAAEVIVFKGKATIIYQSAQMSCADKMVHMFPGWWDGFTGKAKQQCDNLVRRVVKTMRVKNHILGVQVMFDWREGPTFGCHFIEANLRPHDWKMLSDPGWGWRHNTKLFDYGAVGLAIAMGVDPLPLIATVPKHFRAVFASVCPLNITGPGGFMDHGDLYKTWMAGTCQKVSVRPTAEQAYADIAPHLPCKHGRDVLDVTPALRQQCMTEVGQNWFWWANADLLRADINSLVSADAGADLASAFPKLPTLPSAWDDGGKGEGKGKGKGGGKGEGDAEPLEDNEAELALEEEGLSGE